LASHSSLGGKFGRQFATTVNPLWASDLQIAVPRPPIAPVTNAIFFAMIAASYTSNEIFRAESVLQAKPSTRGDQYMC
jgi:hypothetical protein